MSTMDEIVLRAYRKIGVVAADEAMTADQHKTGLDALNSMMAGWSAYGVEYLHPESLTGGSEFPLPFRFEQATVNLLAQDIAPDAGLSFDADTFLRLLQAHFLTVPSIRFDGALTDTPSQRYSMRGFTS